MTARSQPLGVEPLFDRLCKRCKQRNNGNADYHVLWHELWLDVNPIAPGRFSFISRCFFCKNYKADSDVQAPFLVAESTLPSEFTGGMLILFQLDHRHPEFPAQVSGADGNYSTGQLESLAKDFRNKLSWRIALLLQFHRLGTLPVSFYFPPALFF